MAKYHITYYNKELKNSLIEFNKRISDSGMYFSDPSLWQFSCLNQCINQEFHVLLEENVIRAITAIKNQDYYLKGTIINFKDIQLPLSESVVDMKYVSQTIYFLQYISNLGDNMHALGMGGLETPLPKILIKRKFHSSIIPFYIFPINTASFLKLVFFNKFKIKVNSSYLFLFKILDFFRKFAIGWCNKTKNFNLKLFSEFTTIDDELWNVLKHNFDLISIKDNVNLNILYKDSPHDLLKYRVLFNEKYIGYLILKITQHNNHKYFQDTKTLTIVDLFCQSEHYSSFIKITKEIALSNHCDLILVNSSYSKFNKKLLRKFFISVPSNFGFVYKTEIPFDISNSWITRADGDGPINL